MGRNIKMIFYKLTRAKGRKPQNVRKKK